MSSVYCHKDSCLLPHIGNRQGGRGSWGDERGGFISSVCMSASILPVVGQAWLLFWMITLYVASALGKGVATIRAGAELELQQYCRQAGTVPRGRELRGGWLSKKGFDQRSLALTRGNYIDQAHPIKQQTSAIASKHVSWQRMHRDS